MSDYPTRGTSKKKRDGKRGQTTASFLSPDDQYAGTEDFQAFIELTTKRDELEKKIEERYSQWISATGGKSAPPGVLFVSLQKQWYDLNDEAERIQNTAEARVRALKLPRLFL
ncbi:hypothetical protein ACIOUF_23875 [Pseudomonas iridis]|uniref:Uncharacterized protein n=1 Tax=Pseudomonas iridis TaxID=2710587 RepID=A0ABW8DQ56_9PSED|nr:hypothetical protein [Pseudomonas fluorescens]CEL32508.1 hypothetical protein SRM1_05884 [Pseudomonas fluorescens]